MAFRSFIMIDLGARVRGWFGKFPSASSPPPSVSIVVSPAAPASALDQKVDAAIAAAETSIAHSGPKRIQDTIPDGSLANRPFIHESQDSDNDQIDCNDQAQQLRHQQNEDAGDQCRQRAE